MSCVAELNAMSQSTARLIWKNEGRWGVSATSASAAPITRCRPTIHSRLVRNMSTKGDQSGLITQGRYSQLVYSAMSVFEIPLTLYMTTDSVSTTKYGTAWPKYSDGTHSHGFFNCAFCIRLS